MINFKDKTVLVTGASRGIGKTFAETLASFGARLVLVARSRDALETLARDLHASHGCRCDIFVEDLSRTGAAKNLYEAVRANSLDVDVVINNAGFGKTGLFLDYAHTTYTEMVNLNINGLVELTHLFLPDLLKKGDGGIINVASTAAFQAVPYMSVYAATKAFVLSFSEGLAWEYRKSGVTILGLCPGGTDTNFFDVAETDLSRSKMGRLQPPHDVVRIGLEAFLRKKSAAVTSLFNFTLAASVRFFPRRLVTAVAGMLFKPKKEQPAG